jgi:predicted transcriptional regulator
MGMLPSLEEIPKKRRMLGLTQKELARLAGVSQSLIAKLESGKIDSSYTKAKAIFDALKGMEVKKEVPVGEILHSEVVCIQKDEKVSKAARLMRDYDYSQLPVLDGERVVGSISEKTILGQILAGKELSQVSELPVEEVMEEAFPQVGEDAPLSLISSVLQVYPAVLVSRKGKIVGIVTKADLLKILP